MRRLLLVAAGFLFVLGGNAFAFHDGGVADCQGCHTMHNSQNGALVDPNSPNGNPWLLKDATPSDVCLSCHGTSASRGVFAADPLAPGNEHGGGDYVFLTEDNLNDGHGGATSPIPGNRAGHNIVAPSRGVAADGTLLTAPGGIFSSSLLGCSSCHDPHGNTNFRLLYGIGSIQDGQYTFTQAAPDAIGITLGSSAVETDVNHTAYLSGMSDWCGNCHGDFHNTSYPTELRHPSGAALGGTISGIYNRYNGTLDQTGAVQATSYLKDVPFEDPANTVTSTAGPSATSRVMCLTCHRAHANSAMDAGRWDFTVTLMYEDGDESGSFEIPNPYGGAANHSQRSLCNKCHNKDVNDEIFP